MNSIHKVLVCSLKCLLLTRRQAVDEAYFIMHRIEANKRC